MISLILAQVATRWGQALTMFMLSLAATVAAVSAPAYATAVERSLIADEVAAADPVEMVTGIPVSERQFDGDPGGGGADQRAAARAELSGFEPVNTVQIHVREGTPDTTLIGVHRMISREGICRRVEFERGRCPVGTREAAIPAAFAEAEDMTPGQEVVFTPMVLSPNGWVPEPVGSFSLTVVGVFRARDETDPYWFPMDPIGVHGQSPAIVVPQSAMWSLPHQQELLSIDAVMPPDLLTPERLPRVREQLAEVDQRLIAGNLAPSGIAPGLPRLLDRITAQSERAEALLPVAVAPLLALSWFVIHLAIGYGMSGRRHEIALAALRGVRPRTRLAVVAGEAALPVAVGAPVGLLLTPFLVGVAGPGPGSVRIDSGHLIAAALAVVGSLIAVLVAVRRELSAPVTDLLRRVPSRRRRVTTVAGEVLVLVVAAAFVADLRVLDGELVGVTVVAPAAVMLAVAVLVARVVRPLVDFVGTFSLRRGRLGPALAARYLARRPGVVPLLVTVGVALGMLGFAVASADVARAGQMAEAERALGAARVLEVADVTRGRLLRAVRAADPSGRYAMAVVAVPGGSGDPDALAVDATRLAAVAAWPEAPGEVDIARIAELLRPPAPEPVVVHDGELVAELSPGLPTSDGLAMVTLRFSPATAAHPVEVTFGPVTSQRREYTATVSGCPEGCRLSGVALAAPDLTEFLDRLSVMVHSLRQDGADVGPAGWLDDGSRWRSPEQGLAADHLQAAVVDEGLSLWQATPVPKIEYEAIAQDSPYPLPVVTAGTLEQGDLMTGVDRQLIRIAPRADLSGLPGVEVPGALVDLEYAERLAVTPGRAEAPRVWLAADAPVGIVDELREQGLVVTDERSVEVLREALARSGPALALRFHLLGAGLATLIGFAALALMSAVDRRTWSPSLGRLRVQGVARRTTSAAALWSYGGIVVAGAMAGAPAVATAWLAAGERMPLGLDPSLLPSWPRWTELAGPWAVTTVVLVAGAVGLAWWQRGVVRPDRR